MAYWWKALREEISGTIDDFREKGAWGAVKDATLDAMDLIQDAGTGTGTGTATRCHAASSRVRFRLPGKGRRHISHVYEVCGCVRFLRGRE